MAEKKHLPRPKETFTKAESIRNARNAARILKSRRGIYNRVLIWKEQNTEDVIVTVILKHGFSFEKDFPVPSRTFRCAMEAMRAIHKMHKINVVEASRDWRERLANSSLLQDADTDEWSAPI